jgi:hypothetical protein
VTKPTAPAASRPRLSGLFRFVGAVEPFSCAALARTGRTVWVIAASTASLVHDLDLADGHGF